MLRRELRVYEGGLVEHDGDPQQRPQGQPARLLQAQRGEPGRVRHRHARRRRSTSSSRATSRTAPSCSSAAAGASSTASSASSRSAPRTSSAAASRSASRCRPASCATIFDLSYFVPWFLDRPQSIGVRASTQTSTTTCARHQERYPRNSKGAVLTYGRNFRLFQSASISYNRSNYDDETRSSRRPCCRATPPPATVAAGQRRPTQYRINNSSLRPAYLFDSRDNPFEPTRGQQLSLGRRVRGRPRWAATTTSWRPEVGVQHLPAGAATTRPRRCSPSTPRAADRTVRRHARSACPRALLPGRREQHPRPRYRSIFLRDENGTPLRDQFGNPPRRRQLRPGQSGVPFRCSAGRSALLLFADAGNVFGEGRLVRPLQPARDGGRRSCGSSCRSSGAAALHLRQEPRSSPAGQLRELPVQYRNQLLATNRRRDHAAFQSRSVPKPPPPASSGSRSPRLRAAQAAARSAAPAHPRSRVIDTEKILLSSARGKKAVGELKRLQEQREKELGAHAAEIKDLQTKINDGRLSLAQDKLADSTKSIEEKDDRHPRHARTRHPRAQQEARRDPGPDRPAA